MSSLPASGLGESEVGQLRIVHSSGWGLSHGVVGTTGAPSHSNGGTNKMWKALHPTRPYHQVTISIVV